MINKINSITSNPLFLKSINFNTTKQVYFQGNDLNKDIFIKSENIKESKNSAGFDFAVNIIEKLKNQEEFNVNNEIKKFLNENNINNVDIKPIEEFKNAKSFDEKEDEFGDILFALVNIARWNKIDPELALEKANKKFTKRFNKLEEMCQKSLNDLTFDEYDELWQKAKKLTKDD